MNKFYEFLNIKDLTKTFSGENTNENIKYATLCYIGFLFLIPIFSNMHKKSRYILFHVNQGFNLFVIELFVFIVLSILNSIFINIIGHTPVYISLINFVCYLLIVSLMLYSLVNTINGKSVKLPIIGKYRFIRGK